MSKTIKNISLVIFLAMLVLSCSAEEQDDYCDSLLVKAKDQRLQELLINWVSQNIPEGKLPRNFVKGGGLMIPGSFYYPASFKWGDIGFSQDRSQIRLLGVDSRNITQGKLEGIKSVLFAERSRYGIIIKLSSSDSFGLNKDSEYLTALNDHVGVVCMSDLKPHINFEQ